MIRSFWNLIHFLVPRSWIVEMPNLKSPKSEMRTAQTLESWTVRWISRDGIWNDHVREESRAFTSHEAAEEFRNRLKQAFKLIKHTSQSEVTVEKN